MDAILYPEPSAFEDCVGKTSSSAEAASAVRRCWAQAQAQLTPMVGAMTVDLLLKQSLRHVRKIRDADGRGESGDQGFQAFTCGLETLSDSAAQVTARLFLRSVHTSLSGMVGDAMAARMLCVEPQGAAVVTGRESKPMDLELPASAVLQLADRPD